MKQPRIVSAFVRAMPLALLVFMFMFAGQSFMRSDIYGTAGARGLALNRPGVSGVNYATQSTAGLSVTMTASPSVVTSGGRLTFTISVTNAGPATADRVSINLFMPPDTTFSSSSPSQAQNPVPVGGFGTISSTIGSLPAGASSAIVTIVLNVLTPPGANLTTTTTVTSDQGSNSTTLMTPVRQGSIVNLSWEQPPPSSQNQTPAPTNLNAAVFVVKQIGVGMQPARALITPNGAEVYVSNLGSDTVSVINTTTDQVTDTVPVGTAPVALAVTPDSSKVFVGQQGGNVSVIDTANKSVNMITTAPRVNDLAITPNGKKVYLATESSGLLVIDTSTNMVSQVSPEGFCAEGVVVTPDGQSLYVNQQCGGPGGSVGHDAVGVFNAQTGEFIQGIKGFPNVGSFNIAVSPDGTHVWEDGGDACRKEGYDHIGCPFIPGGVLNVISTNTNSFIKSIGFAGFQGDAATTFFPDSRHAAVGGPSLLIFDTIGLSRVGSVPIPVSGVMAFKDGSHAYAPLSTLNSVAILGFNLPSSEKAHPRSGRSIGARAITPADTCTLQSCNIYKSDSSTVLVTQSNLWKTVAPDQVTGTIAAIPAGSFYVVTNVWNCAGMIVESGPSNVASSGPVSPGPLINTISRSGKDLLITGENFDSGAVILMNGQPQKTLYDQMNPSSLVGKKLYKKIEPGQTVQIQVENQDGSLSNQVSYMRPLG